MSQQIFSRLFYNTVDLTDGLSVPACRSCGKPFKTVQTLRDLKALLASTADVNRLVDSKCPSCDAVLRLYVALHKQADGSLMICVQRSDEEGASGIPSDWWVETN